MIIYYLLIFNNIIKGLCRTKSAARLERKSFVVFCKKQQRLGVEDGNAAIKLIFINDIFLNGEKIKWNDENHDAHY